MLLYQKPKLTQILEELFTSLDNLPDECLSDINIELENRLSKAHRENWSKSNVSKIITDTITSEFFPKCESIVQNIVNHITTQFSASFPTYEFSGTSIEFKKKTKKITITNETVTRGTGGALGGVAGGLGGVALLGFLISNPAGWAVAATSVAGGCIGGALGAEAGNIFTTTQTKDIEVGDNFDDVVDQVKSESETLIKGLVKQVFTQVEHEVFQPLQQLLSNIENEITATKATIEETILNAGL